MGKKEKRSGSLVMREIQTNATVNFHFASVRMPKKKKKKA